MTEISKYLKIVILNTAQEMKLSADLVTFTEVILKGIVK